MKKDWEIKKLGDVCEIIGGTTPSTTNKSYWDGTEKWITPAEIDINKKYVYDSVRHITKEAVKACSLQLQPKGTVIFTSRAPIGKVAISEMEFYCNQGFKNFVCSERILNEYLYYFLIGNVDYLNSIGKGTTFKEISKTTVSQVEIPLPPLEEQKRIVKILDEKFAQLETIKTNAQTNLQNAKDLLFAELTKTFSKETWSKMTLQDVCTRKITDGTHQTPKYCTKEEGGYPFISSKDVTKEYIDWSNIKYIIPELHEELYKRIAPQKGDVLLAKNGTTGVAAIVEDDRIFDIYVTLAVLRPNQEIINSRYLLAIVNSPLCKKQFDAHLKGSGVPNLHLEEIQKIIIPVPPLNEQKELISKIEVLKEKIHSLQEIYTKQIANCDELKQAYLQKAFEGEL